MPRSGRFYVRFMDDILVLTPTRWKLRRAVRVVNEVFGSLRMEKHPDKTFIGRIQRGFDFLGYHFGPDGLGVARATIEKFIKRASRLYEQKRIGKVAPDALGMYIRRWTRWVRSGDGEAMYGMENGGPKAAVSCRTAETCQTTRLRRDMKKPSPARAMAKRARVEGSGMGVFRLTLSSQPAPVPNA